MHAYRTDAPQSKSYAIAEYLRSQIVSGKSRAGARLPTFVELEEGFAVGRTVIQDALEQLKRDGFVRSEGRRGLFVAEYPPHLFHYGLVVPATPGDAAWCQLMTVLNNEAHRLEREDPRKRVHIYYGAQDSEGGEAVHRQLQDDVTSHRLAGIILSLQSSYLARHPELMQLDVPRVYLWAEETADWPACITVDTSQLVLRALRHLRERGRSQIAVLQMADTASRLDYPGVFAEAGVEYHRPWIQRIGRSHPEYVEDAISLLFDARALVRPDGLLIADDNLVVPASRALLESGLRVGVDMDVVAHCNWPWPPHSILPMARIGFDVREVLRRALECITQQRQGLKQIRFQRVPAQFESEVAPLDEAVAV